jgi:hypothetical protein
MELSNRFHRCAVQSWKRTPWACLLGTLVCVACSSTEPARPTTWGSDQASLVLDGSKTTVKVLASGGCYGSWGEIGQPVSASFSLAGTYTQLMGVYPGYVEYAAQYTGTIAGDAMTLTIVIPSQQRTIGPFHLTAGVAPSWSPCLYP